MSYDFSRVNVLVVESTPEMFKLFKNVLAMLEVPEINIHAAYSAEEGFAKFKKGKHDIVITDWLENPDKGIALLKMIRNDKNTPNRFVPVIMTAGSGHLSRVLKSRDAGVSEYLVKPFAADALAVRITRVIENPRPFVIADSYVGPERRRKNLPIDFPDRRKEQADIENE